MPLNVTWTDPGRVAPCTLGGHYPATGTHQLRHTGRFFPLTTVMTHRLPVVQLCLLSSKTLGNQTSTVKDPIRLAVTGIATIM